MIIICSRRHKYLGYLVECYKQKFLMIMAGAPSSYDELLYGRSMSFSLSEVTSIGGPECSICSERYDDQDKDLIPRNLSCGHSMCSSEFTTEMLVLIFIVFL